MNINIKDLTKEQRDNLRKQLEDYSEQETVWDLEPEDDYFYIKSTGVVYDDVWQDPYVDLRRRHAGNVFLSHREAVIESNKRQAITKVNTRISELNKESMPGWEPDWDDIDDEKYNISLDIEKGKYYAHQLTYVKVPFVFDMMYSSDIARQIIEEMEDELNVVFDLD